MKNISKADALSLVSKWDRQNQSISVLCFSSMIALTSKNGKVVLCLDDCVHMSLADMSELRIFISEAIFAMVEPEDFPSDFVDEIPKFQQAICIDFPDKQMRWYLAGLGAS
jgi:hypothetical protein